MRPCQSASMRHSSWPTVAQRQQPPVRRSRAPNAADLDALLGGAELEMPEIEGDLASLQAEQGAVFDVRQRECDCVRSCAARGGFAA